MTDIYLASPLGFAESTRAYMVLLATRLETIGGVRVLNPWTLPEQVAAARQIAAAQEEPDAEKRLRLLHTAGEAIAAANERALLAADLVVAVLDGPDVDSGTAAEIGYAAAMRLPIFGLRSDLRRSGELEGLSVNLQLEWWITSSGGAILRSLEELEATLRTRIAPW